MKNTLPPAARAIAALCLAAIAAALTFSNASAQGVFNTPDPLGGSAPDMDTPDTPTPAPAAASTPAPAAKIIVNANQRVQPNKRGVCENHMSAEDFRALAPGVSWFYNWSSSSSDMPAAGDHMDFVPMAWGHGGDAGAVAGAMGDHPRAVLAINEPNLRGQAFLTPEATAEMYKEVKQVADANRIPVVGPNMALGSGPNDSIKAMDPILRKDTVYTWFGIFVDAFKYYAQKSNTQVGSLGVHSYKDMNELTWAVNTAYQKTGRPVWVTEFANWNAKSPDDEMNYMRQAVEFLENSSNVAGYAWFMNRAGKNPKISLLGDSGKLTALGQEYVKMPSHSVNVFYRIPGLLDAGKYVVNDHMTLRDTTDESGDFDMVSHGASSIDYNLQVDAPGVYLLKFRVSGAPGKMDILEDGQLLGSVDSTETRWHTLEAVVTLPAGSQTLRITCSGQALHSIDFAIKPGLAMK